MTYARMTRTIQRKAHTESRQHLLKVKEKFLRQLCEERGLLPCEEVKYAEKVDFIN
ncbi:hypothetical protein [Photobacterium sanguinicancri]|uniref:Uncharacterized protein n=1 Tax=Photobacterium sanguinicancri TaxID=875932 RepID=A0AAW7Y6S7_9GAMM|nr:hypothetical protein [Photobacterium sanguinicancri]MDO6542598.1 hypothetical protein [Photobacterium sanguinicancri]